MGVTQIRKTKAPALDIEDFEETTRAVRQGQRSGGLVDGSELIARARELIENADEQLDGQALHPVGARLIQIVRDELEEALQGATLAEAFRDGSEEQPSLLHPALLVPWPIYGHMFDFRG